MVFSAEYSKGHPQNIEMKNLRAVGNMLRA